MYYKKVDPSANGGKSKDWVKVYCRLYDEANYVTYAPNASVKPSRRINLDGALAEEYVKKLDKNHFTINNSKNITHHLRAFTAGEMTAWCDAISPPEVDSDDGADAPSAKRTSSGRVAGSFRKAVTAGTVKPNEKPKDKSDPFGDRYQYYEGDKKAKAGSSKKAADKPKAPPAPSPAPKPAAPAPPKEPVEAKKNAVQADSDSSSGSEEDEDEFEFDESEDEDDKRKSNGSVVLGSAQWKQFDEDDVSDSD